MKTAQLTVICADPDEEKHENDKHDGFLSPEIETMLARSKRMTEDFDRLQELLRETEQKLAPNSWGPYRLRPNDRPVSVLVVEDNLGDVALIQEAIRHCPLEVNLRFAFDGQQGLTAVEEVQPDLIILDLNLPRLNGFEVLKHCQLVSAPVVVFTSSEDPRDQRRASSLGATAYVCKPCDVAEFISAVCRIVQNCFA